MLRIVRLTPPGRAAIAVLLLAGPQAADVLQRRLHKPVPFDTGRPIFAKLRLGDSEHAEQVVLNVISQEEIEIHSHGGPAVVAAIEKSFVMDGAVQDGRQQTADGSRDCRTSFDKKIAICYLPSAVCQLPFAKTERTAQILVDQLNGALEREMAEIDALKNGDEKRRRLDRLAENAKLGRHLIDPFRVVLAGATNAGKSSILNAVIGFERVIVHHEPGTTRDVVSVETAINGFPVLISDTAGFRDPADDLERQGMIRGEQSLKQADLIVWVSDVTAPRKPLPTEFHGLPILYCGNKTDLLPVNSPSGSTDDAVWVSAKTGEGIDILLQKIISRLIPREPAPFEAVPLP